MTSPVKSINHIIIAISSLFLLPACSSNKIDSSTLSVTIEPQRYFLEQLVGDKYTVVSLVPAGSNPESFDPAPSQMLALNKSAAYFKIGFLGIENTLVDKVKDESKLTIIDCSRGIDVVQDNHEHEDGDEHEHHAHSGGDPHYWSSTESAKIILKNMLDAIINIDPANKEFYTSNYQAELSKICDTESVIKGLIQKTESKAFIIYHPALSYFAREYQLEQLSIEHEGKNPSPSRLKTLIDDSKEKRVKAVFIQQEFDVKNAETIAQQIGAKTYTINLLSYNWHDEMRSIAKKISGDDE